MPLSEADDRYLDQFLDPPQLLEILVRAEDEPLRLRKIGRGFGEGVGGELEVFQRRHLLRDDLLLEQRVHHDRGGAGVLQALHLVEVVRQRRGAGHERVGELES